MYVRQNNQVSLVSRPLHPGFLLVFFISPSVSLSNLIITPESLVSKKSPAATAVSAAKSFWAILHEGEQ